MHTYRKSCILTGNDNCRKELLRNMLEKSRPYDNEMDFDTGNVYVIANESDHMEGTGLSF